VVFPGCIRYWHQAPTKRGGEVGVWQTVRAARENVAFGHLEQSSVRYVELCSKGRSLALPFTFWRWQGKERAQKALSSEFGNSIWMVDRAVGMPIGMGKAGKGVWSEGPVLPRSCALRAGISKRLATASTDPRNYK
jgi:hypothetical protein